jgi:hypothetical protein
LGSSVSGNLLEGIKLRTQHNNTYAYGDNEANRSPHQINHEWLLLNHYINDWRMLVDGLQRFAEHHKAWTLRRRALIARLCSSLFQFVEAQEAMLAPVAVIVFRFDFLVLFRSQACIEDLEFTSIPICKAALNGPLTLIASDQH